jgi:LacI family transcriptional regulator
VHIAGDLNRNVYADRLSGYKRALAEGGLPYDAELILINSLTDEGGVAATEQILKMKKVPDGIFSANDTCAVACIRELKAAGVRVPEEIAVVGFNNDPISRVIEPDLTTVDYPGMEIGEQAASTLIQQLKNPTSSQLSTIVLDHKLIIRKSSIKKNSCVRF